MLLKQFIPSNVTIDDRTKYARVMSNWTYLSTYLSINDPSIEVLGKLVYIELHGRKRRDILDRLVSRLVSGIRREMKQELESIYEGSDS